MKRTLSILTALLLLWSLALPAAAAETATAATLRLEKTEGTVKVSNASGKSVTVTDGMRLYSGYTITTEKNSYAYVSLDSTKAVKLDASSKAEVQKSGKKLELMATAGKLFFNVSAPVDKDESLNIRTSTMVTGVRGTSGWVEVTNRFTSRVHLLEGTLTVTSSEPATGQMRQATITSGQTATATLKGISQPGGQMTLTVTPVQEKLVPGFVAVEVEKNPALQQKIAAKSQLSVPAIIGDAWTRLENEQVSANAANQKIQQDLNKIAADDVDQVFQSPAEDDDDDDDDDDEPYVPPAEPETPPTEPETPTSITLDDPSADELTEALANAELLTITVVNAGGENSDLDTASYTVGSGQTLVIQSGTFTVGADQFLFVEGSLNNSGTLELAGRLEVTGTLTNTGTVTFMAATDPTDDGTLFGSIQLMGSFENSGDFAVTEMGQLICMGGTYTEHRRDQFYAMVGNDDGYVYWLAPAGEMPVWYDCTTVTLLGAEEGIIKALPPVTVSDVTLDLNGRQVSLASSLVLATGANRTITDSSEGGGGRLESMTDDMPTIRLDGGSLTVSGGTVTGTGTAIRTNKNSIVTVNGGTVSSAQGIGIDAFSGTVTVEGGTVSSESGTGISASGQQDEELNSHYGVVQVNSGTVTSTSGSAILLADLGQANIFGGTVSSTEGVGVKVNGGSVSMMGGDGVISSTGGIGISVEQSGTVMIFGGTVKGAVYGIQNSGKGTVSISGGTVILTADDPAQFKYFTMYGPFTFEGGTLTARDPACLFDMMPELPEGKKLPEPVKDENGFYHSILTP